MDEANFSQPAEDEPVPYGGAIREFQFAKEACATHGGPASEAAITALVVADRLWDMPQIEVLIEHVVDILGNMAEQLKDINMNLDNLVNATGKE